MKRINCEERQKLLKGYRVTVTPCGATFVVHENETVLEAALRCGYFFPHQCRMGVCATCKGRLLEGEIDYAGLEILGLSREEQREGYVLFCSAKPKTNLVIQVDDVVSVKKNVSKLVYKVKRCTLLAKDISQVILQSTTNEHIHYLAGQYVHVIHHDKSESPMSIACAPFDLSTIELHLYHPQENQQAIELLAMIKNEGQLPLQGPYGKCTASTIVLDKPVVFLANGVGFAPVKAVMEELLQIKNLPPIHLYWCALGSEELYLNYLIKDWEQELTQFYFTIVDHRRLVDSVLEDYPDLTNMQVYMVDGYSAVQSARSLFIEKGLEKEFFYSDLT